MFPTFDILLILSLLFNASHGINKCFVCDSGLNTACLDPFPSNTTPAEFEAKNNLLDVLGDGGLVIELAKQLSEALDRAKTAEEGPKRCLKFVAQLQGPNGTRVQRDYEPFAGFCDKLKPRETGFLRVCETCDDIDGCNGAINVEHGWSFAIFSVLLLLLVNQ